MRFIHKNGKVIPIHSDHGDEQNPGPQHAKPMSPPNTPAPVPGHEHTNHPAPMKENAAEHAAGVAAYLATNSLKLKK